MSTGRVVRASSGSSSKRTDCFTLSNGTENIICTRFKNSSGSYDYQFTGMKVTDVYLRLEDPATIMMRVEDFVMEELNYPAEIIVTFNNCLSSEVFDNIIGAVSSEEEYVSLPADTILLNIVGCMIDTAKRIAVGKPSVYVGKKRSGFVSGMLGKIDRLKF